MLRIHFLQQWHAFSDPAVEEALYDSVAMRRVVGIDLSHVPLLAVQQVRHLFGDAGYIGSQKRAPKRGCRLSIAAKRSVMKAMEDDKLREITERLEHAKASIRAVVEHTFRVLKRQFGFVKVRYKRWAKNGAQVTTLFALVNLWMARGMLLQHR